VVENRPGAGGAIGVEAGIRAPADGHTLLLGSSGPIAILPAVSRKLSYDPLRDLLPLARVADFPLIFIASLASGLGCEIARNTDPLRAVFASNPDPSALRVSVSPDGPGRPGRALGDDVRGRDRRYPARLFRAAPAD
jgi:hypothetical protein